ncbi:HlyD family secretion protein [Shewanella kaireitica]|uniref:HlyD family secretion protein n=1 Tax=Shewanella kaireitica TaxID=212021 RepID=UPI00200DD659|nr:efflux RND transporter periplasmic adaptor subunit [Shewanella kaireitica]MCL1093458.1 efflux RND transporter periplasmic adaptor subunit [Shewanella kaireitica]
MIEGLAVWALLIYILRLVGMPWNKFTKSFSYAGGTLWLLFVWVGLLNYTPMDMSGGSLVQSPHIQLRPASTQIKGNIKSLFVKPNERVKKGQLIYELDDKPYQISVNQAQIDVNTQKVEISTSQRELLVTNERLALVKLDMRIIQSEYVAAVDDLAWKEKTLERYKKQNAKVPDTVTRSLLDEQVNIITKAISQVERLNSESRKNMASQVQAELEIDKSELKVEKQLAELARAKEVLAQAKWNLENTKVYAPANGYVTNFILREGQYVGAAPRLHMYTDEKYVLMRVNHQAIRNVKVGQSAEFASAVYPGKVFNAVVEGIIEATGEAQGSLIAKEDGVRQTTIKNMTNKHHFVRLKIDEIQGRDLPVGAAGLAWVAAEKPITFLNFLDVIRGVIIRMKAQIFFFYSM